MSAATLADRPLRQCLACDSTQTTQQGRVLNCGRCETSYFIPAVQLARQLAK